jgi:hypothetical protein
MPAEDKDKIPLPPSASNFNSRHFECIPDNAHETCLCSCLSVSRLPSVGAGVVDDNHISHLWTQVRSGREIYPNA